MNLANSLQVPPTRSTEPLKEDEVSPLEYWDIIVDNRKIVIGATILCLVFGTIYSLISQPIYEANLLIQVENSSSGSGLVGDVGNLLDIKTAATAEIEIIRSRMVLGPAVTATRMHISAQPNYIPLVGQWLARRSAGLSEPGFFGMGGWVSGKEAIEVSIFEVPNVAIGSKFSVTALADGRYRLSHPGFSTDYFGTIGSPVKFFIDGSEGTLLVNSLRGKPGAEFVVQRFSHLTLIEALQSQLRLSEKSRQSGVIEVSLTHNNPKRLTEILNEIGAQYVRQNIERKAAEAHKTLTFLNEQLPQLKRQLDESENAYNKYRNQQGTVSLNEEARLILSRSVDLQAKLLEAQQQRIELLARFTEEHPSVRTLAEQISSWQTEIGKLNAKIRALPAVQQDIIRFERDLKVNTELYQQLRNNALQLQLIKEGKVGNVRLIDAAVVPERPIAPKRPHIVVASLFFGGLLGIVLALLRAALFRGIRSEHDIEAHTGLAVYNTVPLSTAQEDVAGKVASKERGIHILADLAPHDPAVESLRSLRTTLQFAMLDAPNRRIVITGPTPGVGKSFLASNFAAVTASAGKRTLLIDADLRKGHLNQYFGLERDTGLSEMILEGSRTAGAVRNVMPNLDFISTGSLPPNPAELVVSSNFTRLLDELSDGYDLVVIDTAPVLVAADSLSISPHAAAVILVVRAEQTQLGEIVESAKRLAHTGKGVTGVVLNAVDFSKRHYGKYGYKYSSYQYKNYSYHA